MFTEKQTQLISIFKQGQLKRINLLEGSVRSGKTWISLVLWALWVATMPKDGEYLMVAKTLTSLSRNCLNLLQTLVGSKNFTYSTSKKEGRLFGRLIYLEGVNDARAESKIRGMTLTGAYCDEATLFTEDFFTMLLSRLSEKNAKLFATTNPDSPNHWLMTKYINRQDELNMMVMKFLIDDNTFLDPEYVKQLKIEYTGVFYDRFILGLWKVAEGLIYPMFNQDKHVFKETLPNDGRFFISIDYGTLNPMAMLLWNLKGNKAFVVKEYYYDGRKTKRQKTDEEYYQELEKLAGDLYIESVIVDPSAASFIECINRHGRFSVQRAVNAVLDGIRVVGSMLNFGMIKVHESCENTMMEFVAYAWDEKSLDGDKPVKESDHAMDALRYFAMTILNHEFRNNRWG